MLYKLVEKFSEDDKRALRNFAYDDVFILRYVNSKCYINSVIGRGECKECEFFKGDVSKMKSTYDLFIPNRIVEHRHRYLTEVKGQNGIWYDCWGCEDGNLFAWLGMRGDLCNAIESM